MDAKFAMVTTMSLIVLSMTVDGGLLRDLHNHLVANILRAIAPPEPPLIYGYGMYGYGMPFGGYIRHTMESEETDATSYATGSPHEYPQPPPQYGYPPPPPPPHYVYPPQYQMQHPGFPQQPAFYGYPSPYLHSAAYGMSQPQTYAGLQMPHQQQYQQQYAPQGLQHQFMPPRQFMPQQQLMSQQHQMMSQGIPNQFMGQQQPYGHHQEQQQQYGHQRQQYGGQKQRGYSGQPRPVVPYVAGTSGQSLPYTGT